MQHIRSDAAYATAGDRRACSAPPSTTTQRRPSSHPPTKSKSARTFARKCSRETMKKSFSLRGARQFFCSRVALLAKKKIPRDLHPSGPTPYPPSPCWAAAARRGSNPYPPSQKSMRASYPTPQMNEVLVKKVLKMSEYVGVTPPRALFITRDHASPRPRGLHL